VLHGDASRSYSRTVPVEGSWWHGDEPSCLLKGKEFLEKITKYQSLRKDGDIHIFKRSSNFNWWKEM
jgi:hypothetical protein